MAGTVNDKVCATSNFCRTLFHSFSVFFVQVKDGSLTSNIQPLVSNLSSKVRPDLYFNSFLNALLLY